MRADRAKQLAEAVAASFESAGYTPVDLLQGPIKLTNLVWQAPPLHSLVPLAGLPFHTYLDYPYSVDSEKLHSFYSLGLRNLQFGISDITSIDGYSRLGEVMPDMKSGERDLALFLPDNWPVVDSTCGPLFALEVARLFKTSSDSVLDFVEDEDNYYAKTPWGDVGIVDGYTSEFKEGWDVPCHGIVQALLEQPRGYATTDCQYDILARVRSALHEEPERFAEFEGIDYAIQALRILSKGGLCKALHQAVQQMSMAGFKRKQKAAAFKQAVEVMSSWEMSDRAKLSALYEILVPQYYNMTVFSRKVYDMRCVLPAVLSDKVERRILNGLKSDLCRAEEAVKYTGVIK